MNSKNENLSTLRELRKKSIILKNNPRASRIEVLVE
jgi:hypothetical protein